MDDERNDVAASSTGLDRALSQSDRLNIAPLAGIANARRRIEKNEDLTTAIRSIKIFSRE